MSPTPVSIIIVTGQPIDPRIVKTAFSFIKTTNENKKTDQIP